MPLGVANPHGPLGLERLAAAAAEATRANGDALSITIRPETREKLERLAYTQGKATSHPITAAEVAAAIVEEAVLRVSLP